MAEEFLQSNIVIATKFSRPETGELKSIHGSLLSVENRLKRLTDKPWKIRLEIDDAQLRQFNLQLQKVSSGNQPGTGGAGGPRPMAPGGAQALVPPRPGAGNALSRTTSRTFIEGEMTANQVVEKQREIAGGLQKTQTQLTETVKDRVKLTREEVDLYSKARSDAERKIIVDNANLRARRELIQEGRQLGRSVGQDVKRGQFPLTMEPGSASLLFPAIVASERDAAKKGVGRSKEFEADIARNQAADAIIASSHKKTELKKIDDAKKASEKAAAEELAIVQSNDAIIASSHKKTELKKIDDAKKASEKAAAEELAIVQSNDAIIASSHKKTELKKIDDAKKLTKKEREEELRLIQQQDEIIASGHKKAVLKEIDNRATANRKLNAQRAREEGRDVLKQYEDIAKRSGVGTAVQEALSSGFKAQSSTRTYDALTNSFKEIHNLTRVTGNALAGYRVEVLRADEATGKMTSRVLTGSAAYRFLGDSVSRAIGKVVLWSVATGAVFASVRAFQAAALAVVDLEEQIAFLARVSSGFAAGSNDFDERYESALRLTNQILELTQVYGGNASKAIEAAAIFARSGLTEQEVLAGVQASLIAARIAELDLVDSAKLLSSAMLQFNLKAHDLMPTLDSLNTLSNNYRVSTQDLLQAISRTGSVFAEHGGRLTELAAITAVVAERTSRTGTEIGNAIKTISSNLDRLDVQKSIMEQLGVFTVDLEGKSKSLSKVLLELRGQLDGLNSVQQKQLLIQIAGVRQANILIAAIKDIDKAIEAENKALLGSGSAQEEAQQRAFTFRAALERISATLIKVAYDAGGPLVKLSAAVLNIVDSLLRFMDSFDGLGVKVATGVTVVYLLARALTAARIALNGMYIATLLQVAAQGTLARSFVAAMGAWYGMGRAAAFSVVVLNTVGNAFSLLGKAIGFAVSPMGLFTIGLLAVTFAVGAAAKASNTYNESLNNSHESILRNISAEQNRRQAIENSVEAISMLIARQKQLRSEGKEKEAGEAGAAIEKIAGVQDSRGHAVLPGVSSGNSIEDVIAIGMKEKQESIKREKADREADIANRELKIQAAQDKIREIQRRITSSPTGSDLEIGPGLSVAIEEIGYMAQLGPRGAQEKVQINAMQAEKQAHQELIKLIEEQAIDQQKINELTATEFKDLGEAVNRRKLLVAITQDQLRYIEHQRDMELEQFKATVSISEATASLERQHAAVTAEAEKELHNLEAILVATENAGEAEALFGKHAGRVNDLLKEQAKLRQDLDHAMIKSSHESFGDILGVRDRLYGGMAKITEEKKRGLSDTSSKYGDELAYIEVDRQQQLERIRANKVAGEAIAASTGDPAVKAGALEATKLDTQDALNRLKDLEVDKVLSILEAEKNIAIERKKSADEAGRALGSLSTEDKLRARAQAAFFARNPGRKISFEEQLNMRGGDVSLGRNFFGGRYEDISDSRSGLATMFGRAGLGVTEDMVKGEAEIGAARRGRTDADLYKGALGAAGGFLDVGRRLSGAAGGGLGLATFGSTALGPGSGRGVNAEGGAVNKVEVGLREGTFDFTPLTEAFREVVQHDLQDAIQAMAARLKETLLKKDTLKATLIPKTALGTPAP